MHRSLPLILFVGAFLANVSLAQESNSSTPQELREFGGFAVGSWVGEGILADDIEGIGKKGEKITGSAVTKWDLDGKVVTCNWNFGAASGIWIATWDPVKGQINRYNFSSTGGHMVATMSKKNDKWIANVVGSSEGKPLTETDSWTSKDGGNTIVIDETNVRIGGEKRPDIHHEWKRAGK